jgi:hypothetical protein
MSNIFKTNSRFASLIDDISESKKKENRKEEETNLSYKEDKFNSFKSERRSDNFRLYDEKEREKYKKERENERKIQMEFEEREKERKKQELLNINNFPELVVFKKNEIDKQNKMNFIEKINNENQIEIENNIDPDLVNLKPGWILIKNDPKTRKTIIKNHPENKFLFEKEVEKSDKEIAYYIIDSLVKLHEKRTEEYINVYGYDTWEKIYKFPNWDEEENNSESESDLDEDYEDNHDIYENDDYYN